jgi:hypothetical protein
MFMLDLFSWWYGAGWSGVVRSTGRRLNSLGEMFSTKILLRTLFSPWKRIMTYPGAGLDARMRAFGDNLVSRCIGFVIRSFVLFAAFIAFIFLGCLGLIELLFWPLVPLVAIALIVKGVL